MKVRRCNRCW